MTLEHTKRIALELFSSIGRRDLDRLESLMHPDLRWWVIGEDGFGGTKDREGIKESIALLWKSMKGPCTINMEAVTAEDDRVSLVGRGDMVTTEGAPYLNTYSFLVTVQGEQVIGVREYFDTKMVDRIFAL